MDSANKIFYNKNGKPQITTSYGDRVCLINGEVKTDIADEEDIPSEYMSLEHMRELLHAQITMLYYGEK